MVLHERGFLQKLVFFLAVLSNAHDRNFQSSRGSCEMAKPFLSALIVAMFVQGLLENVSSNIFLMQKLLAEKILDFLIFDNINHFAGLV